MTGVGRERTAEGAPLLDVAGLRVSIGDRVLVDGLSLQLHAGECVAIVGESGAGKSVTARSLLGAPPRGAAVQAERLSIDGTDARALGERAWQRLRGRRIAMIAQDALGALDPLRRVGQEVAEAAEVHGLLDGPRGAKARARREQHVLGLLERVAMPEPAWRAGQWPHELSGGLRQRAVIASALSADPRIVIADEPTTALDVTVQAEVLRRLGELKEAGLGILLISHDLAVVAGFADRILVMRGGTVVEEGPARQVLTAPREPYTRQLVAAIPSGGPEADPAAEDAPVLLEARGLGKAYPGQDGLRRSVLEDVSLVLRAGETLGVVGESGSGKSTLARLLLGLAEPDAGAVMLRGEAWSGIPESRRRARRPRVQAVPQHPLAAMNPRWTVQRILSEAMPGASRSERARRSGELLEQVGLAAELLRRRPGTLSGGQRQRVAIARALASDPDVLICDEPVSALDVTVQAQVLALLDRLRRERGLAMVFISHDLGVVRRISRRSIVLHEGRVVEEGETAQLLDAPRHPYTQRLVASIPRL